MDVVVNCRVIRDYERKDPSELSLKVGDVVEVLKKGKYIWYGRFKDDKGFFPSRVVKIEEQTSEEIGKPLLSIAVVDNEKNGAGDSTAEIKILMDSKKSEETFKEIESTTPLEDKRRSRPRSAGRPPSQVFIKETILQKSDSMENLDNVSDDEENKEQHEESSTVTTKISSVSQIVMELKNKPNLKLAIQKDAVENSKQVEQAAEGPTWMKGLPKKKVSVPDPIQKSENTKIDPPWLQEVRKRREHKLSLKGDEELLRKVGQEFASMQDHKLNRTSVEIQSFGKTRSTNQVITEKTCNIQTKSVTSETHGERSINARSLTTTETKVHQSYSSSKDNLDKSLTLTAEDLTGNIKNIESALETQTENLNPIIKTISTVVVTEVTNSPNSATEQSECVKDTNVNSKKIEQANATKCVTDTETTVLVDPKETDKFIPEAHSEQPQLPIDDFTTNTNTCMHKNTENQLEILKEQQVSNLQNLNEQIADSVQLLINQVDSFETQYKIRSSEILEDIKKLEASLDRQNQETKKFIESMKGELSALAKSKY